MISHKKLSKTDKDRITRTAIDRILNKNNTIDDALHIAFKIHRDDIIEFNQDGYHDYDISRKTYDSLKNQIESYINYREKMIQQYGEEVCKYL